MFLDPTNDIAFRKIFCDKNKKEILISFLNSILELSHDRLITTIEIANPYLAPKLKGLKESILDVCCIDKRKITYIVEMQVCKPAAMEKRALYYTAKAYANQIERGDDYPKLNQVIFLGILYFNMFEGKDYVSNHLILDVKTHENKLKDFRFSFVELLKFNKTEDELESVEDKWIYFLKNATKLETIPEKIIEKEIKDAFRILAKHKWSKKELEIYETIGIRRQDARGRIENAWDEGHKEGFEEGQKEKALKIAKNLIDLLDIETIAIKTGLSIDDIKNLFS